MKRFAAIAMVAIFVAALYVLLPEGAGISYMEFFGVHVVAMVAAIASHVPGGLGVFEAVIVLAAPGVPSDALLASFGKGFDWEKAGLLMGAFAVLVTGRGEFYRKASMTRVHFTPAWVADIVLVVIGTFWLGLFSYKHVEYSGELW